jgi:adenylate cyclase
LVSGKWSGGVPNLQFGKPDTLPNCKFGTPDNDYIEEENLQIGAFMNRQFKRKYLMPAVVIILSALLILLADAGNVFAPFSLKMYDTLFYLKSKTADVQPDSRVVIAAIDDKTFDDNDFKIPMILWHTYFGEVIKGLADSGAKVIALDFLLPRDLFDDIAPDYSKTWLRAFAYAASKGTRVIAGYIETKDRQIFPHDRYVQIIGTENIGLFNLTTDADDFVRRQRLIFPGGDGRKAFSFSYLAALAFQPDISPNSEMIYIDYIPGNPGFPKYSFSDIYRKIAGHNTDFLTSRFQGKIVCIGATDSLNQDRHPTPLYALYERENKRTNGTEIVANIIDTLLGRRFFSELSPGFRFGIYLFLASAAGILTFWEPRRYALFFSPVLLVIYGGISLILFLNYVILPVIPGLAVMILCQVLSFSYRYILIDKEKRRLRRVFQRFLPPKVVSQLIATKDEDFFRGQNKRLCILFSDIRSFTSYSESRSPEEVVARLNEYFEVMSRVVSSHGGIVDKFLGDGLMAFFGAFEHAEHPSAAGVRAAMNMLEELEILNRKWLERGQVPFKIGIGLHAGTVKVGNIGSRNKTEYTVIGDAVNTASRLQDKTKMLQEPIVISEDVYNDLSAEIIAEDRGVEEIRGRSPIRVYGLRGMRSESES